MSADVIERKAYFVGIWRGDVVSDNIIRQLRVKSEADKGKKVKIRLSKDGVQIRKPAMFQASSLFDVYRMADIFFMTVNQQNRSCLLCIVRDLKHKYAILAFRCSSDLDAGLFVQNFKSWKSRSRGGNYELKRKQDGNWTLRNRSTSPTRQPLQIPNGRPAQLPVNGDVRHVNHTPRHVNHTPMNDITVLPDSGAVTKEQVIMNGRQQHNIGIQTKSDDIDMDQMSEVSDVSAFRDELESLSQELREIKFLLEKSTGISVEEHYRRAREAKETNNNDEKVSSGYREGMARVYVSNREPPKMVPKLSIPADNEDEVFSDEPDFRSYGVQTVPGQVLSHPYIKTSEVAKVLKREFSSSHLEDKTPRVMAVPFPADDKSLQPVKQNGLSVQTNGTSDGHSSAKNSVRVKFDSRSLRVAHDQKSRSMRLSSDFMVPSTVPKPIEKTYARPTILRPGYGYDSHRHVHPRRNRPQSLYIMSGAQPLKVQNPKQTYEAQF